LKTESIRLIPQYSLRLVAFEDKCFTIMSILSTLNTNNHNIIFPEPRIARNLRIISRTVASLTVSWDAPMSGRVVEYNIMLQNVSKKEQYERWCSMGWTPARSSPLSWLLSVETSKATL